MAGCMADGCRTVAPKKASSVASSNVSRGTGRASFTILGSEVSTPARKYVIYNSYMLSCSAHVYCFEAPCYDSAAEGQGLHQYAFSGATAGHDRSFWPG